MSSFKLITEFSLWFIIPAICVAGAYSWLLYSKKGPWSPLLNKILFSVRFILIFLLCFLLIGPLLQYIKNEFEKPIFVFAIDDSESNTISTGASKLSALKNEIEQTQKSIQEEDYTVDIITLSGKQTINEINFKNPSTNLDYLLDKIESNYENRNLAGTILFSDGIYNQGLSPAYKELGYPLYTIGLGDTTAKKDIILKNILYNKLTYQGNSFPIVAEIQNQGFEGKDITVIVKNKGKVLDKKVIKFSKNYDLKEVEFRLSSDEKGLQHYEIEVTPQEGEFTDKNNTGHAYIDVIEGKEKILLVASSPHPDIKAIKSVTDQKENYSLNIYIPGITEFKNEKYDLIIFHQIPDLQNTAAEILSKYGKDNSSVWYITGNKVNYANFNQINNALKISQRGQQLDQITALYNADFNKFSLTTEEAAVISKYPPVSVPFGEFKPMNNAEVIIYQRLGNIQTVKPLLLFSNANDKKEAVFCGEGLWEWRLLEFKETGTTKVFDKLVGNLIQLLSSREEKRKFKVYPINSEFFSSDPVLFETEVYNDIYEKIYGQNIDLTIISEKNEKKHYSYVNNENSRFEIKGLSQGIYKYVANTVLNGKKETSEGEFLIKELNIELINGTSDFDLLRTISEKNKGIFLPVAKLSTLPEILKNTAPQNIIHSNEELSEIINLKWVFFLLLSLITFEWFFRKFKGSY